MVEAARRAFYEGEAGEPAQGAASASNTTPVQGAMSWLTAAMDEPNSATSVSLEQRLGQTHQRNQNWSPPSKGDAGQVQSTFQTPSAEGKSQDAWSPRSECCRANAQGLQTETALQAVPGDELRMLGADEEAELLARVADVLNATPPPRPPTAPQPRRLAAPLPMTSPQSSNTPPKEWKFLGIPLPKPWPPGS